LENLANFKFFFPFDFAGLDENFVINIG
jgi:hypothetical protein